MWGNRCDRTNLSLCLPFARTVQQFRLEIKYKIFKQRGIVARDTQLGTECFQCVDGKFGAQNLTNCKW